MEEQQFQINQEIITIETISEMTNGKEEGEKDE